MALYVQYGCGWSCPEGWLNFDASPTLRFERLPLIGSLYTKNKERFPKDVRPGDIVKGLPIEKGTCDGVYASHVLEHLSKSECEAAIANTFGLLKPGGIFRCVVPDLRARAERYLSDLEEPDPTSSHAFMRSTSLGVERWNRSILGIASTLFGKTAHLWMWDELSLGRALEEAGFVMIRRCDFGDCEDTMFNAVEDRDRFFDPAKGIRECAMEARKPHAPDT